MSCANIFINKIAQNTSIPLPVLYTYVGSHSTVTLDGMPSQIGDWSIETVKIRATYPDNSVNVVKCSKVGSKFVGTLPAPVRVGQSADGLQILGYDGEGQEYVLGVGDVVVSIRDSYSPDGTSYYMHICQGIPADPTLGDVYLGADDLLIFDGKNWQSYPTYSALSAYATLDNLSDTVSSMISSMTISVDLSGYVQKTELERDYYGKTETSSATEIHNALQAIDSYPKSQTSSATQISSKFDEVADQISTVSAKIDTVSAAITSQVEQTYPTKQSVEADFTAMSSYVDEELVIATRSVSDYISSDYVDNAKFVKSMEDMSSYVNHLTDEITAEITVVTSNYATNDYVNGVSTALSNQVSSLSNTVSSEYYKKFDAQVDFEEVSSYIDGISTVLSTAIDNVSVDTSDLVQVSDFNALEESLSDYVETSSMTAYVQSDQLTAYAQTTAVYGKNETSSAAEIQDALNNVSVDTSDLAQVSDLNAVSGGLNALSSGLSDYAETSSLTVYVETSSMTAYVQSDQLTAYAQTTAVYTTEQTSSAAEISNALNNVSVDTSDLVQVSDFNALSSGLSDYAETSSLAGYAPLSDLQELSGTIGDINSLLEEMV